MGKTCKLSKPVQKTQLLAVISQDSYLAWASIRYKLHSTLEYYRAYFSMWRPLLDQFYHSSYYDLYLYPDNSFKYLVSQSYRRNVKYAFHSDNATA